MRRTIIVFLLLLIFAPGIHAQELKCTVQVMSQKVQGSNKQVYQTLQTAIYEFMNNHVWTDHIYELDERIECNFMFNITDQPSADQFKGTLQIQANRPVYNTNYNSTMINMVDGDISFRYIEFEPLEFDLNTYTSSLTSLLAFYAYYILGVDYDSFSFEGGTEFFKNAEKIVLNAQNAPEVGWKPVDDMSHRNRYWMVTDILDQDYAPLREFSYRYHRHGLDVMNEKVADGRAEIANSLELLQKVYRDRPDPYMHPLQLFFDSKADELSKIFSESFPEEKNRAYAILVELDQTNEAKYKTMLENTNQTGF